MNVAALRRHLGHYLGAGEILGELRGVELWVWKRREFVSVTTVGLSNVPLEVAFPQEIVCSVLPDQLGAAEYLARLCLDLVLDAGRGLVNEDIIPNDGTLLEGTVMEGVLISAHPQLGDEFNVIMDGTAVAAEMMTVVPITGSEVALGRASGVDALIDTLESADPVLLDVERPSAV